MTSIESNQSANLKSGFKKCGIYPTNADELLRSFNNSECVQSPILESFKTFLKDQRNEVTGLETTRKRKKKLNVAPGQSISYDDLNNLPSTSYVTPVIPSKNTQKTKKQRSALVVSSDSDSVDNIPYKNSSSDISELDEEQPSTSTYQWKPVKKVIGEYVVFTYEGELFPGKIIKVKDNVATISAMQRSRNLWKWPNSPDILDYIWQDVIGHADEPKKIGKRSLFSIPELNTVWGNI